MLTKNWDYFTSSTTDKLIDEVEQLSTKFKEDSLHSAYFLESVGDDEYFHFDTFYTNWKEHTTMAVIQYLND